MSDVIDDRTYQEVFDIENDAKRSGSGLIPDPNPLWAQLLAEAPIHPGSLAECMGMPKDEGSLFKPGFEYFSVFSFSAVNEVYMRKADFSSEFYYELGVDKTLGDNLLIMDGMRHRRYRNVVQEFFQPASAGG